MRLVVRKLLFFASQAMGGFWPLRRLPYAVVLRVAVGLLVGLLRYPRSFNKRISTQLNVRSRPAASHAYAEHAISSAYCRRAIGN